MNKVYSFVLALKFEGWTKSGHIKNNFDRLLLRFQKPTDYLHFIIYSTTGVISTILSALPPLLVHIYTFPVGEMAISLKRPNWFVK